MVLSVNLLFMITKCCDVYTFTEKKKRKRFVPKYAMFIHFMCLYGCCTIFEAATYLHEYKLYRDFIYTHGGGGGGGGAAQDRQPINHFGYMMFIFLVKIVVRAYILFARAAGKCAYT